MLLLPPKADGQSKAVINMEGTGRILFKNDGSHFLLVDILTFDTVFSFILHGLEILNQLREVKKQKEL